jgi:low affinity Fe/Cu permease
MTKKASKLDLGSAYAVTVIVLIALAVLVWIGTTPLYSF